MQHIKETELPEVVNAEEFYCYQLSTKEHWEQWGLYQLTDYDYEDVYEVSELERAFNAWNKLPGGPEWVNLGSGPALNISITWEYDRSRIVVSLQENFPKIHWKNKSRAENRTIEQIAPGEKAAISLPFNYCHWIWRCKVQNDTGGLTLQLKYRDQSGKLYEKGWKVSGLYDKNETEERLVFYFKALPSAKAGL